MHARSALFDLYGDHLRSRGDRAPVASLVRLLAPLGVTAAAVRTAISRMVRQGWLDPERLAEGPGYALTEKARHRLDDAAARIYRTREPSWRGCWDLLVLGTLPGRSERERVRSALGFLGYAPLSDSTWISPEPSAEVEGLVAAEGGALARFDAHDPDPAARAAQAWDLAALSAAYESWLTFAGSLVDDATLPGEPPLGGVDIVDSVDSEDERAFAVRSLLVHEWRKFLFIDPGLPADLLPDDWAGHTAGRFFSEQAAMLLPAASRFVDRCLAHPTEPAPGASGPVPEPT
jgi:phenylacetic acid degradation operon negative regulatory protein